MALRFVCKKCGYINTSDSSFCANCKEDLTYDRIPLKVDKTETKHFYNYLNKEYCDKSPFEADDSTSSAKESYEEEPAAKNEEISSEKGNKIKICPLCGTANDVENEYCYSCDNSLRLVKPTQKEENQVSGINENKDNLKQVFNERKPDSFSLVFGKNGENAVKLELIDNLFIIGRDYQSFLENEKTVSRKHCCIKKGNNDSFFLFESPISPSTNHTYLRLMGGRLEQIIPGKLYPISSGAVFVLADKVPVLFKKELC